MNNPTPPNHNADFRILYQQEESPRDGILVATKLERWICGQIERRVLSTTVKMMDTKNPDAVMSRLLSFDKDWEAIRCAIEAHDTIKNVYAPSEDVPFAKKAYMDEDDELYPAPDGRVVTPEETEDEFSPAMSSKAVVVEGYINNEDKFPF